MDIEYVKKEDKDGNYINFIRYMGHVFIKDFPKDVETRLDKIQEMPIRSDDVIFVEFPKAGKNIYLNNLCIYNFGV